MLWPGRAATITWLAEAPEAEKTGIAIEGDGGAFQRICTKLCTGGGKTTVMAMLIAWQVCNKAAYPQDKRFTKNVFIAAPGITVKSRLQVLRTGGADNYYAECNIVPPALQDKLHQGKVVIENGQSLSWDTAGDLAKKKSVDKRGPKSDEACARQVLGSIAQAKNILVINDGPTMPGG
jgi:type III restriction enzyme